MSSAPRIWVLLGHRRGDNNQLLALAQGLGLPFETRSLRYNVLRRVSKRLLGAGLRSVVPDARRWLQPPWPDLVIGVGHRSVPVARWIKRQNGGRTRLVRLGNPRIGLDLFDLVITMPQYSLGEGGNVVRLPFAMGAPGAAVTLSREERDYFDALPRPHRLFAVGGPNKHWTIPPDRAVEAVRRLVERCEADGGTLLVVGSPRTEPGVLDAVEQALCGSRHVLVRGAMPRYPALLLDADEIHVTADSVSMLSEAMLSGKPVGMMPVVATRRGRLRRWFSNRGLVRPARPDLALVWQRLDREGLVGTIDEPVAAEVQDPVGIAAAAVRKLLD